MCVIALVACVCAAGAGRAAPDPATLGEALELLTRSSGHRIEIRPAEAAAWRVPLPPADAPFDRALDRVLSGVNYTILRTGTNHLLIQVLDGRPSLGQVLAHRPTVGAEAHVTRNGGPERPLADAGEVETAGREGVQKVLDLDDSGDQGVPAGPHWVGRRGPDGVEERVRVLPPGPDAAVDDESWQVLFSPDGVRELVRPIGQAADKGPVVD